MSSLAESMEKIADINRVEGFDPSPFAVEYTDMETGEARKRLPVAVQIAWFRLKHPDGKISVSAVHEDGGFTASARVYVNYTDNAECYLAEAEAWRGPDEAKPSVSAREWAQTAAIGIALRNAGFGLQIDANEPDSDASATAKPQHSEPSNEEHLSWAMNTPCPISKYSGKTLGEVLAIDPNAITWVANKFTGSAEISKAAKEICEYAVQQTSI
jgi:hypothetical protein